MFHQNQTGTVCRPSNPTARPPLPRSTSFVLTSPLLVCPDVSQGEKGFAQRLPEEDGLVLSARSATQRHQPAGGGPVAQHRVPVQRPVSERIWDGAFQRDRRHLDFGSERVSCLFFS